MRSTVTALLLLAPLALLAGCGGKSDSDQAMASVCSARADIQKQVSQLQALTPTTATTAAVKDGLKAIRADLSTIKNDRGKLSDDRRQKAQAATDTFTAEVRTIATSVGRTVSVDAAAGQLKQALTTLGASYRSSVGRLDCSS